MNLRTLAVLAAAAFIGLAAWPSFVATREAQAAGPTPAPVVADYAQRGRLVTFYEDAVRRHPDQIVTRMLASLARASRPQPPPSRNSWASGWSLSSRA